MDSAVVGIFWHGQCSGQDLLAWTLQWSGSFGMDSAVVRIFWHGRCSGQDLLAWTKQWSGSFGMISAVARLKQSSSEGGREERVREKQI